ncbi:MAG: amidohydrolase family protein, partial [Phycisphaerae bacterium]
MVEQVLITAAQVIPMGAPAIDDGAVLVEGGIVRAVGARRDLMREFGGARVHALGEAALLPGLVNAHTHLEMTLLGPPPGHAETFVDWVLTIRARASAVTDWERLTREAVGEGVRQCLACGVTCVGDIANNIHTTRAALATSPIRGVSFGEVLGMARRTGQFAHRLSAALDRSFERPGLVAGIEPHAPYSIDLELYRKCVEAARKQGLAICTHLAETPDEAEFLAAHAGQFKRLWDRLEAWDDSVTRFAGGPVRAMKEVGLLDVPGASLAHANYVDDEELELLAGGRASVIYCPRTHAYFGHPEHRLRDMLSAGINVAVGTDSAASSPDLNLLEELRVIYRKHADLPPSAIFELATLRAARALG